ncbi:MAG: cyclic nucleotide-binding domain-containing protein [Syntrophales bacterium]|nr:cyclic nucleotide-binding domain-containing protein [Syntrophales bacterium]
MKSGLENDIAMLREPELFRNLSPQHIRKLLAIGRRVYFQAGDEILREGDMGDKMYIMMEGTVEVIKRLVIAGLEDDGDNGKNKVFTRLDAKDHAVFGEMALLETQKRTATVKALTDCRLYEIAKDDFLRLVEDDYELGYRITLNLARIVSARLRKADEETVKLTTALSIILKEL